MRTIVLIVLISLSSTAIAQEGVAVFALMAKKFHQGSNCENLLKAVRHLERPAIAVLWQVFGKDLRCYTKLLSQARKTNKRYFIQFHFDYILKAHAAKYNRQVLRMRNSFKRKIERRLKSIAAVAKNDVADYALSFGLEATFKKAHYEKLYPIFKRYWDHKLVVSNYPRLIFNRADYIELHGYDKRPNVSDNCILNGDGTNIANGRTRFRDKSFTVQAVRRWAEHGRERSCILLLWRSEWQDAAEQFIAKPLERNFKFSSKDINLVNYLLR